jgi:hypothetical protein
MNRLAPLLLLSACVAPPPEPAPLTPVPTVDETTDECGTVITGVDALLAPGKTLIIGELHGTRELPAAVGTLACMASRHGPVVVGVELSAHPTFDAFLASDGGEAARTALLSAPAWREPMQDGRTSEAMVLLVERVRQLRQQGRDVELLAFDASETRSQTRDRAMADLVLARRAVRPDAAFVLLMGNLHARKVAGSPWKPSDGYGWLASLIAEQVVSLDASYPAGTAWLCTDLDAASCAVNTVQPTSRPTRSLAVRLEAGRAYDGLLDVATVTASPPAVR